MSDKRSKNVEEISKLVYDFANDFNKSFINLTSDYSPKNKFLIYGRVLNVLFANHYGFIIQKAKETMNDVDNSRTEKG